MASEVRSSYSPAIGMPRAVRREAPRIIPAPSRSCCLAVQPAVVVGEAVQVEVLDQAVQADGHLRAPREVVVVHGVVDGEDLAGELRAVRVTSRLGDRVDPYAQVVELQHLHVPAEVGRHQVRSVDDVEHARVEVAHQPVPAVAERARGRRRP